MKHGTRKPRKIESADERVERRDNAEQLRRDEEAAEDQRIDEMVKHNVKRHGG